MKTTKKHFELFKAECEKWIEIFNLASHKFYFAHENYPDDERSIASCVFPDDMEDRVFNICLSKDINMKLETKDIIRSGFHEVMEAFIFRLARLAHMRFIQKREIDDEVHNIIRTLEKVIWEKSLT